MGMLFGRTQQSKPLKREITAPVVGCLCDQTTLIRFLLDAMSVAGRYNRSLSLVLLEINDRDKLSRNRHQHLEAVADQLATILRLPDRIGCFEHNALMLLLPETGENAAAQVASRCRDLCTPSKQQQGIAIISKTVVASYRFGDDLQSLLDRLQSSLSSSAVSAA